MIVETAEFFYSIFHVNVRRNRVSSNRISNDARTVKKPGFWGELQKAGIGCINSASIGLVKSNQQSILNYHSVFRQTVNSQQSTVNYNSGATGIDLTCISDCQQFLFCSRAHLLLWHQFYISTFGLRLEVSSLRYL